MEQPLDLEPIKAREAAATPGPWTGSTRDSIAGGSIYGADGLWLAETGSQLKMEAQDDANNAFIAHAREDVPALVAEVGRLRARLDEIDAERLDAVVEANLRD